MRSVVLSNSTLIVTSPPSSKFPDAGSQGRDSGSSSVITIRDSVSEIIELNPVVPKLHQLDALLEGLVYDEDSAEAGEEHHANHGSGSQPLRASLGNVRSTVQASEKELERGLRERWILNLNGYLRPIALGYLSTLLGTILNLLATLKMKPDNVSLDPMCHSLVNDHGFSSQVCTQVMSWFGEIVDSGSVWVMDIRRVVKAIGLAVLQPHQRKPIEQDSFIAAWKDKVGDEFEGLVDMALLSGNVLISPSPMRNGTTMLTYFPRSSLPIEPAARFSELFSVRPRWNQGQLVPFLEDIAVDSKSRDQLLLKYTRAVADSEGAWYTSRTNFAG